MDSSAAFTLAQRFLKLLNVAKSCIPPFLQLIGDEPVIRINCLISALGKTSLVPGLCQLFATHLKTGEPQVVENRATAASASQVSSA